MTAPKLTKAQREALESLADGARYVSRYTKGVFVHHGSVRVLERLGLAMYMPAQPHERFLEVFTITDAGRAALKADR